MTDQPILSRPELANFAFDILLNKTTSLSADSFRKKIKKLFVGKDPRLNGDTTSFDLSKHDHGPFAGVSTYDYIFTLETESGNPVQIHFGSPSSCDDLMRRIRVCVSDRAADWDISRVVMPVLADILNAGTPFQDEDIMMTDISCSFSLTGISIGEVHAYDHERRVLPKETLWFKKKAKCGYQLGRMLAGRAAFPRRNDYSRAANSALDWEQTREIAIRARPPRPDKTPSVQVKWRLPNVCILDSLNNDNPFFGLILRHKSSHVDVDCWAADIAWDEVMNAIFSRLYEGYAASRRTE